LIEGFILKGRIKLDLVTKRI